MLLAIMDILATRSHSRIGPERPASATRSRMRRRDPFSISSIQLADLGRYLSALFRLNPGAYAVLGSTRAS